MVKKRPQLALLSAVLLASATAAVVGWFGFLIQQYGNLPRFLFPLIFPLLLGVAVGAATLLLGKSFLGPRRVLLTAIAVVAGGVAVTAQTAGSYRAYAATIETAVAGNSKAALAQTLMGEEFKPAPPLRFVKTQIQRSGGWWFLDAAIIILASAATCRYLTPACPSEIVPQSSAT